MPIVVQKCGGTSVGDTDRIRSVADRIVCEREHAAATTGLVGLRRGLEVRALGPPPSRHSE
jgi:hypothetical protein